MKKVGRFFTNILVFLVICFFVVFALRQIPHPHLSNGLFFSTIYYDKNNQMLRFKLSKDDYYRVWISLDEISSYAKDGVLLYEDKWFYYHAGFNPFSLIRGAYVSYIKKGSMQGGSTITMQLARMKYKLNTRTIKGKLIQIAKALELELFYSKDEILEAYFNYAPYGRNIEGIESASLIYFNKHAKDLSLPEALTLAVLPQSPSFRIDKQEGVLGDNLVKARNNLFKQYEVLYDVDDFTKSLFKLKFSLRQPERLPFIAPHYISQIENESFLKGVVSQNIYTTLDVDIQKLVELQVKSFIDSNKNKGIKNAAVLVVDSSDMSVVAHMGSSDFFNYEIEGQINGVVAKRSPGSTLKPFIYALAIEQGIIHPLSILKDVPTSFSSYAPENFDHKFIGPLSATSSLVKSRNIPAVYLSSKIKNPNFYHFLKQSKVSKMESEGHYGLALALGGGEVSMMEVAKLYGILANKGKLQNIRNIKDDELIVESQSLSEDSVFITLEMLKENPRIDGVDSSKNKLPIYWKTGTSWGFKDAWSSGIVGKYIVVVWLGNFDNRGNAAFIGANSAAPLFFNIVNSFESVLELHDINSEIPERIKKVEVCLSSGNLATIWCKRKAKTWFIPGISPIKVDNIYRPVIMNNKTRQPACLNTMSKNTYLEVFEYWPSDIYDLFEKAGLPKRKPPDMSHCDGIKSDFIGIAPLITSPLRNTIYTIRATTKEKNKIILSATTDASVKTLYWFIDDEYIGNSDPFSPLEYTPVKSGKFTLSVVDDHARADRQTISILITEE